MCHPGAGRQGRFLTVREAAGRFGISERHMRRLIRQGKFPATKLEPQGAWRVPDYMFDTEFMIEHMTWNFQRSIEARQRAAGRTTPNVSIHDPEYQADILRRFAASVKR